MFRKIVSNIAFSPALVGQLSFYARRLRKEQLTRRLGLIFTALALIVQAFAVVTPPEAANASSSADFVRGGVTSVADFLRYYDSNYNNIKSIYNSIGITRDEITTAKPVVIDEASRYNWSMTSLYSAAQGQRSWNYGAGTAYYRPMRLTQEGGDRHEVYAAYSKSMGWFAIKKDCGNLVTESPPRPPQVASCADLDVVPLSSTRFRFTGKVTATYGATIQGYTYTVKNAANAVVSSVNVNSATGSNVTDYTQATPGTYTVSLTVRTSLGPQQASNCNGRFTVATQPAAECKALIVSLSDRTIVSANGGATTQGGATIKSYTFVTKDKNGKIVKTSTVNSALQAVSAPSFTLPTGTYTMTLTVTTSVGQKTAPNCTKSFTVVPPKACAYNPELTVDSPDCQPCPGNPDVWIKDDKCSAEFIDTKTASNLSQGNVSASTKIAQAGDRISYTITIENRGLTAGNVDFKESLGDVLEYSNLIDAGGGVFDKDAKTLTWAKTAVAAHSKQSRSFVVQLLPSIPVTNTGISDEASYDCTMTNTFGNSIDIKVNCPPEKTIIETTVQELPHTGPRENMIFGGLLLAVVVYFYARSRQLGKEVRLVRRNVSTGAF